MKIISAKFEIEEDDSKDRIIITLQDLLHGGYNGCAVIFTKEELEDFGGKPLSKNELFQLKLKHLFNRFFEQFGGLK